MSIAVIDVGSGSVRMLLEGKKTTIMTKLGEGLNASGRLGEEPVKRTVDVIKKFAEEARAVGAQINVFATEAVRAAENSADFIKTVRDECGLDLDVISGNEEAEIALLGAAPFGDVTVVDIGSASVEIISGTDGKPVYIRSLPIGMVRLTEQADGNPELLRAYAASGIAKYGDVKLREKLIGVGGTFTSLAAMKLGLDVYDPEKVQGTYLSSVDVSSLTESLLKAGSPAKIKEKYPLLPDARCELITAGALFVSELLSYLGADGLTVSESDNLDGYLRYKENGG